VAIGLGWFNFDPSIALPERTSKDGKIDNIGEGEQAGERPVMSEKENES